MTASTPPDIVRLLCELVFLIEEQKVGWTADLKELLLEMKQAAQSACARRITDALIPLFLRIVHQIGARAHTDNELMSLGPRRT